MQPQILLALQQLAWTPDRLGWHLHLPPPPMVAASEAHVLAPVPSHITHSLYYLEEPSLAVTAMLIPVTSTMDTRTALTPGLSLRGTTEPHTHICTQDGDRLSGKWLRKWSLVRSQDTQ